MRPQLTLGRFSGPNERIAGTSSSSPAEVPVLRGGVTTYRILYVDDEPLMRSVAEASLRREPAFEVRSVASGAEALREVEAWRPDLVMLDVVMPGMDGPAVLAQLRQREHAGDLPVLFITARARPEDAERFAALGAWGTIAKPFDPLTLAATVRGYLPAA
jgi:CheY-like chemotaxis protein